ncbi:MAG TPA: DUF6089 family protein [Bacteroidia bacterium]|nr:DUF6089 family protein [Bacteroidia bacterium]
MLLKTLQKPVFFALLLLGMRGMLLAQKGYKLEFGGVLGISNYLGEIGGKDEAARPFIFDMKMAKTRWNPGVFVKYQFHPMLAIKGSFNYLRIEGEDALCTNPGRHYRNLSFRNDIYELNTTLNWLFFNPSRPSGIYRRSSIYLTAYLFAGVGGFMHNPKAKYQGEWIDLRPLKTENTQYGKFSFCIPVGTGFYITINQRRRSHRIGLEVNWRYTGTDYLDDISKGSWENPNSQSNLSAALANRNPELGSAQPDSFEKNYGWWDDGSGNNINKSPRGDPKNKDSYITLNVTYGYSFKAKFNRSKGRKIRSVTF